MAAALRSRRQALLEQLLPLRATLVDLLYEAQGMLPADAVFWADVEPGTTATAPTPLSGIELTLADRLRIASETYEWSRGASRGASALALGPSYLLSKVIEHPTPEASRVREASNDSCASLRRFLYEG